MMQDIDPFTDSVLTKIDPSIRRTFTATQEHALIDAIRASSPLKKHPLDIRGVIPLVFARYYFVFFAGRDRRRLTKQVEAERRSQGTLTGGLMIFVIGIVSVILVSLIFFYQIKSALGIDLLSDRHLWDLFTF